MPWMSRFCDSSDVVEVDLGTALTTHVTSRPTPGKWGKNILLQIHYLLIHNEDHNIFHYTLL